MCMVACTYNSRTWEAALKTESWRELQTVGQKGSYGKQAYQKKSQNNKHKSGSMQSSFLCAHIKRKNCIF